MALDPLDFPDASPGELTAIEDAIAEAEEDAAYGGLQDLYARHAAQGSGHEREQLRQIEDEAEQAGPRGSAESRLARAIARIGAGTYLPPDDGYASEAATQRRELSQPGRVLGSSNCGPSHPANGACMAHAHEMSCASLSSTEMARGLIDSGEYAVRSAMPVLDATGLPVVHGDGSPATIGDAIEASAGTRLHGAADFESGFSRPEVASVQRAGGLYDTATQSAADRVKAAMGITAGLTSRERGLDQIARQAAGMGRMSRTGDGETETGRERAQRLHQPVTAGTMRLVDEPVTGSQGTYAPW